MTRNSLRHLMSLKNFCSSVACCKTRWKTSLLTQMLTFLVAFIGRCPAFKKWAKDSRTGSEYTHSNEYKTVFRKIDLLSWKHKNEHYNTIQIHFLVQMFCSIKIIFHNPVAGLAKQMSLNANAIEIWSLFPALLKVTLKKLSNILRKWTTERYCQS